MIIRLIDAIRNLRVGLWNLRRRLVSARVDYVVLNLRGSLPEYIPSLPWWRRFLPFPDLSGGGGQLSLADVRAVLERIASDPRPKGVILRLDGLSCGWSAVESVRRAIMRFRESSKRVVVYAEDYEAIQYLIACAADEIIAPPAAWWNVMGLRLETYFIKDALDEYGISVDVFSVSPYKTAGDSFRYTDMSPEQRENLEQLLDGIMDELVAGIAQGRGMSRDLVRDWIDKAPLNAEKAYDSGFFDAVLYLDELADHLAEGDTAQPARLVNWRSASNMIMRPIRWRSGKVVGVISLTGTIVSGSSRKLPIPFPLPFVGNTQSGSDTIAEALRRAEKSPRVAALVLHVDSTGGANLASNLIWREVARIRRKMPLVVYMGDYAASGGYYVSCDAEWIVASPLTVTGSIGVIVFRIYLQGLLDRLHINRVVLQRGEHAGLFSGDIPLTGEQRQVLEDYVYDLYERFKVLVGEGRRLAADQLGQLAGGRVWSGRQALGIGLVDQIGDLHDAIAKARQLADLPSEQWTPAVWVSTEPAQLIPDPYPQNWPGELKAWLDAMMRDPVWLMDAYKIVIR